MVSAFKPSFTVPHVYQLYTIRRVPLNRPSLEQLVRKYSTLYLNKWNEKISPKKWPFCAVYFYISARRPQIIHTKLRLHISDLNEDLVNRHVWNDASCKCGSASETVEHYLVHCPPYIQARGYTIQTLPRITLRHLCYCVVTQISPQQQIMQYS